MSQSIDKKNEAIDKNEITRQAMSLPIEVDGRTFVLQALLLKPPGESKRPLAVLTHGSPRSGRRRGMTPYRFLPQAMEFAQRGYVTAIVMRRGYGKSDGHWYETYGRCATPRYDKAAFTSATDLRAAIEALKRRADIDSKRILVVGRSAGGIGAIALAALNPSGVVAAINFAGGRGSTKPGFVCMPERLVDAYRKFGSTAKVPTLWVYARNDKFFGPDLAKAFHRAYVEAGGKGRFELTAPFGKDGHRLFTGDGIPVWRPIVDRFLKQVGLPTWAKAPPLPRTPDVLPPRGLSKRGLDHWRRYLRAPVNKAFAKSRNSGAFGWRSARNSIDEARSGALANCKPADCVIVSENGSAPR